MHMGPHMAMGADPSNIKGATVSEGVVRRVARLAKPYRWMLIGFVAVIIVEALIALLPPLLFRSIIDTAIPDGNRAMLNRLAALVVAAAFIDATMGYAERWFSSKIGEGVIFDLRVKLFDHVQRMPIAFFTRTQTAR